MQVETKMTDLVSASEDLLGTVMHAARAHISEDECKQFRNRTKNRISQLKMLNSSSRRKVIQIVKREIGESFGKNIAERKDLEKFAETANGNEVLRLLKINFVLPDEVMDANVRTSLKNLVNIFD